VVCSRVDPVYIVFGRFVLPASSAFYRLPIFYRFAVRRRGGSCRKAEIGKSRKPKPRNRSRKDKPRNKRNTLKERRNLKQGQAKFFFPCSQCVPWFVHELTRFTSCSVGLFCQRRRHFTVCLPIFYRFAVRSGFIWKSGKRESGPPIDTNGHELGKKGQSRTGHK